MGGGGGGVERPIVKAGQFSRSGIFRHAARIRLRRIRRNVDLLVVDFFPGGLASVNERTAI